MTDSEQYYKLIFENSPLGIFHFDQNGIINHCNDNYLRTIGVPKEHIIGFNMVLGIKDKKMHRAMMDALSRKKGFFEGKYHCVLSEKDVFIRAYYSPNIDSDGHLLGGIGIFEDISEKVRAKEALLESEKKYRLIFENSPLGIFHFDKDGTITHCNENYLRIIGVTRDQIIGFNMVTCIIDEKMHYAVMESLSRRKGHFEGKYKTVINGKTILIKAEYSPNVTEEGDLLGGIGIFEDITKRIKAEHALQEYTEELAKANEELKSLDRMKDEFLSNISHELKTPLTSIQGYSQLILEGNLGDLNEQQKGAEEAVLRNTSRLSRLINSLIYMSKARARNLEFNIAPMHITDAIDNAITDLNPLLKKKEMIVEKNIPANLPQIDGDLEKLTDMFTNIIDNSIKFSPKKSTITISAKKEQDSIHLIVSDRGIGISEELIPNLFQRFYQIDSSISRKFGGTGLGLYMCKHTIDNHNGKIWIESKEGHGTNVHILMNINIPDTKDKS